MIQKLTDDMGEKVDLKESYRERISINNDERLFISSNLKITRAFIEMGNVSELFHNEDIEAYEALDHLRMILEVLDEVREEITKKL